MADSNNPKKTNVLLSLFNDLFSTKKENPELSKLDNDTDKLIKDTLQNKNETDNILSELIASITNLTQYDTLDKQKNGTSKKVLDSLLSLGNNLTFTEMNQRRDLFQTYRFIVEAIPQLDNAIDVIVENIMAPDVINKDILNVVPINKNFIINDATSMSEPANEAKNISDILNNLEIEHQLFSWISNCLLTGNTFIEIVEINKANQTILAESSNGFENKHLSKPKTIVNRQKAKEDAKILLEMTDVKNKPIKVDRNENEFLNLIENEVFIFENDVIDDDIKILSDNFHIKDFKSYDKFYESDEYLDIVGQLKVEKYLDKNESKDNKKKKSKVFNKDNQDIIDNGINPDNASEKSTTLEKIMLIKHESENIIRVCCSNFLIGYLIVKEEAMNSSLKNKLFGDTGNMLDLTSAQNKETQEKLMSGFLDKILDAYRAKTNKSTPDKLKSDLMNNIDLERLIAAIVMEKKTAKVRFVPSDSMIEFSNHSKYRQDNYGMSVLRPSIYLSKYYIILLTSYIIFNITRAPEKRVFEVEVNPASADVANSIQNVVQAVRQHKITYEDLGKMDAISKQLTSHNDIFIPSQDGQTPVKVSGIPGQSSNIDINYFEEIRRMIISSLKVPPSLLGDSENSYHTTASQENQKFAETIKRYQHQFGSQLTTAINKIYHKISGGKKISYNKIVFNPPTFARLEQIATMIGQADIACNFIVDCYGQSSNGTPNLPKLKVAQQMVPFIDWKTLDKVLENHNLEKTKVNELSKIQNPDLPLDQDIQNNVT